MNAPANITQPVEFSLPIKNYDEFYRFYLTEHRNIASRRLHATGSSIGLYFFSKAIRKRQAKYAVYGLVSGYACAWVGHFFFEHNKPASFKQPLYSFISDWRMLSDIARGRLSLIDRQFDKIES
ncbi:Mpo1-like protein [Acinetobacter sp. ABJ_C3_5]|uniref:Mpo1-like protein n=1 Tax=Acinetobacter courvalinii TaxID=280147 RepID=UPI0037C6DE10